MSGSGLGRRILAIALAGILALVARATPAWADSIFPVKFKGVEIAAIGEPRETAFPRALALYGRGEVQTAIAALEAWVRRHPTDAEARAALSAALWQQGRRGEAASNWVAVVGLDRRYGDRAWVEETRDWPPQLLDALADFLQAS